MPVRKPHVAGTFYPADPAALRRFCGKSAHAETGDIPARAVILPHAGYQYSGKTAWQVLHRVRVPAVNLLIGPNHTGYGSRFAVMEEGEWETPLGRVPLDASLAARLIAASEHIRPDSRAHQYEHCLEVEVPFLQMRNPEIRMVPLVVGGLDLDLAGEAALAIAEVIRRESGPVLIVISTDMSHYEPDEATRKKDAYALKAIENLDREALVRDVRRYDITMCGLVPVYMLLTMAEQIGITKVTLVNYTTSAEASGDYDRVVGYAGFILE